MNASATVTLLGGLGLFLLGIHHLTEGLKGLAGDSLRRALQRLVSGRFSAVVSGALLHRGDSILHRSHPHRHRLRQRGTGHLRRKRSG